MDYNLVERINELVVEYKRKNSPQLLTEIQELIRLVEYQSWMLKYKLKIIENPEHEINSPLLKPYREKFTHKNAYSKYHLIIPLMLFLFTNHKKNKPALETTYDFMASCQMYLKEGDFAKTKTGVQRFATNTKFAATELRRFGLLRSDTKHYYKTWELSLFGILIAGAIYFDFKRDLADTFYRYGYSPDEAYSSFRKILLHYIDDLRDHKRFDFILNLILEDAIVSSYNQLYEKEFMQFAKTISLVLENGNKKNEELKSKFINLLNGINADKEITKLTNSIILKKDIEVNMAKIFEIINRTLPNCK